MATREEVKRLMCKGCHGCLGLMKKETRKRITYECKVPLQEWEKQLLSNP
jgi:hypothetical protein